MARSDDGWNPLWTFAAGALAGAAGAILLRESTRSGHFDPRLIRSARDHPGVVPTVIVPGILGSELWSQAGTKVWLNARNVLGHHALGLSPSTEDDDRLRPGGLLGVDTTLPRLFGFTEYADLLTLLDAAGFHRDASFRRGAAYHVFTYDWRLDLCHSARLLGDTLDALADISVVPGAPA